MSTDVAVFWLKEAVRTGFLVVGPMLGMALLAGLVVSLFQAVTSMQEMTLSFIPKLIAIAAVFFFLMPWMIEIMTDFTVQIFAAIPTVSK